MKILYRYILSEIWLPFLIGIIFFTFIFILNPVLQLIDLIIVKNVDFFTVLKLFIFLLPSTLAIVFPMATLVAILIAYGRLSSDLEIIAMRASGISYIKIFFIGIIFSLFISLFGCLFNDTVLPWGNSKFTLLYKEILQKKPLTEVKEQTLTRIEDRIIGINKIERKSNKMSGIIIFEPYQSSMRVILAKTGKWLEAIEKRIDKNKILQIMRLELEDGLIQQPSGNLFKEFSNIIFNKMVINFTTVINYVIDEEKGSREKRVSELFLEIKKAKERGENPTKLLIEFHKRFSIPFAALAFVLLAAPLSIISKQTGKTASLGISVIIIIFYYILYTLSEGLARQGKIHPFLSLWLPNLILATIGIIYIRKINKT